MFAFVGPQPKPKRRVGIAAAVGLLFSSLIVAGTLGRPPVTFLVGKATVPAQLITISRTGTSQTWSVPYTGTYDLALWAGGGSGGCANGTNSSSDQAAASAGAAGGLQLLRGVSLTQGLTVTLNLGAGGAAVSCISGFASKATAGNSGANSSVSATGLSMNAFGGTAGQAAVNSNPTAPASSGGGTGSSSGGTAVSRAGGNSGAYAPYNGGSLSFPTAGSPNGGSILGYAGAAAGLSTSSGGDPVNITGGNGGAGGAGGVPGGGGDLVATAMVAGNTATAYAGANGQFAAWFRGN